MFFALLLVLMILLSRMASAYDAGLLISAHVNIPHRASRLLVPGTLPPVPFGRTGQIRPITGGR